jgi:oligosaccharyltransferase complex subunit epsilon
MAPRNRHTTHSATSPSAASPSHSTTSSASQPARSSSSTSKASNPSNIRNAQHVQEIVQGVWTNYLERTPQRAKLIDAFMAFLVIVGGLQFVYCVLAGNYVRCLNLTHLVVWEGWALC